ncbi:hypothetical protein NL676_018904 [Syzygium grande]|nr:hypothetical protein NL676_018904 [Syzygium grande]
MVVKVKIAQVESLGSLWVKEYVSRRWIYEFDFISRFASRRSIAIINCTEIGYVIVDEDVSSFGGLLSGGDLATVALDRLSTSQNPLTAASPVLLEGTDLGRSDVAWG